MGYSRRLVEWINREMAARDWSLRELARRAELSSGALSEILNEKRGIGPEYCVGLARAFRVPPEEVFRRAELLPSRDPQVEDEERALYLYRRLAPERRRDMVAIMETLLDMQAVSDQIRSGVLPELSFSELLEITRQLSPAERQRLLEAGERIARDDSDVV